jgi:hypothetical protein
MPVLVDIALVGVVVPLDVVPLFTPPATNRKKQRLVVHSFQPQTGTRSSE